MINDSPVFEQDSKLGRPENLSTLSCRIHELLMDGLRTVEIAGTIVEDAAYALEKLVPAV